MSFQSYRIINGIKEEKRLYTKRCVQGIVSSTRRRIGTNICIQRLTKARLNTYFTMSFTYDFELPNDTVQFAYAVPYTYSALLKFISTLPNVKQLPPMKSLSGLPIPVLEVTD